MLTILLALLAAATNACSSVLQRKANAAEVRAGRSGLDSLTDLVRRPLWLTGIGAVVVSFGFQAAALATGELSKVQPLMSLELPMTLLMASVVFRRHLARREWLDIGVMTVGMVIFLFALHPGPGDPFRPDGLAWAVTAGTAGGLVVLLIVVGVLTGGSRRAALFGTASGFCFALTAVFMSAALARGLSWSMFTRWQTYLVAVAGIAAMVLLQEGLQAGTLVAVQPGVTLSDPVVAVVLGVILFGEEVRTGGWIVAEVLGAVAVGWGAVQLSRSPVAAAGDAADAPGGGGTADHGPSARPDAGIRRRR